MANMQLFFPVNTNTTQEKEVLTLFTSLFIKLFVGKGFKHSLKAYKNT